MRELEEKVLSKLYAIAAYLRKRGVPVSTQEVEIAYRLYETAKALSSLSYFPLKKIVEAVFLKREEHRILIDEAIAIQEQPVEEVLAKRERRVAGVKFREKPKRDTAYKRGKAPVTREFIERASFKELENISLSKLDKKGIKDERFRDKVMAARQLKLLKMYLETENPGYLDMLREEIRVSHKRRGDPSRRDAAATDPRVNALLNCLEKIAYNPEDPRSLVSIAELAGGDMAVSIIEYSLRDKKRRPIAEAVAHKVLSRRGARRKGVAGQWRKTKTNGRPDLRRTMSNIARGMLGEIVYKRREGTPPVILVVDRSDSMRKHASQLLDIASSYFDITENLILFSDSVEILRVRRALSKTYFIEKLLDIGFAGYTNITLALRVAGRLARPGSTVVVISDMQQTVRDEPYVRELERLSRKRVKTIIYTLKENIPILRAQAPHNIRFLPLEHRAPGTREYFINL